MKSRRILPLLLAYLGAIGLLLFADVLFTLPEPLQLRKHAPTILAQNDIVRRLRSVNRFFTRSGSSPAPGGGMVYDYSQSGTRLRREKNKSQYQKIRVTNTTVSSNSNPETPSNIQPERTVIKETVTSFEQPIASEKLLRLSEALQQRILSLSAAAEDTSCVHNPPGVLPGSRVLDPFFVALRDQLLSGNSNRLVIDLIGDSLIAGDMIPSRLRTALQADFGNGGPGWVCIRKPNRGYAHISIGMKGSQWQHDHYLKERLQDYYLGINGNSFLGSTGDWARLFSRWHGSFEIARLHYLAEPGAGSFRFKAGPATYYVSCTAEKPRIKFITARSAGKPFTELEVSITSNSARIYGAELMNRRGLVLNTFAFLGAEVSKLLRIHRRSWVEQLRQTRPHLVIVMFWGNKITYSWIKDEIYLVQWAEILSRIKAGAPGTPLLVIGPMGLGRYRDGELEVKPIVHEMNRLLRQASRQQQAAYLDLYQLFGAETGTRRWYSKGSGLVSSDRVHLTTTGADEFSARIQSLLLTMLRQRFEQDGYFQTPAPPDETTAQAPQ